MSDASALASRLGALALDLEVESVTEPVPSVRRVRLTGAGLENMAPQPGQDVMLAVAPTSRRRYSVRAYDASGPWIDLDFVLHGDGPAVTWATSVQPGDSIGVIGPRGKVMVDPEAEWHLFIGDDTFVPASFMMAGSLPADRRAIVIMEVDGDADHQVLETAADLDGPHWVHRSGGPQGEAGLLVAALEGLDLPPGPGHAYLAGELRVVSAMRSVLLGKGMEAGAISPKPYWRLGVANQDHGEPQRD
ncbi:MAG TPA: siderophore-interacting protein [Acidimicrobiales bacterium]|nr:siderophore-interacting protein [Acidimicrobiales bacterium]